MQNGGEELAERLEGRHAEAGALVAVRGVGVGVVVRFILDTWILSFVGRCTAVAVVSTTKVTWRYKNAKRNFVKAFIIVIKDCCNLMRSVKRRKEYI